MMSYLAKVSYFNLPYLHLYSVNAS